MFDEDKTWQVFSKTKPNNTIFRHYLIVQTCQV